MKNKKNRDIKNSFRLARHVVRELHNRGAGSIIVEIADDSKKQLKFVNNHIISVTDWDIETMSIFMDYKKRVAALQIQQLDEKSIRHAIEVLLRNAKNSVANKEFMGISKGPFRYRQINQTYDKKIENIGEKSVDIVEKAINAALKVGSSRVSGNLEFHTSKNTLCTSEGAEASDKGTYSYFTMRAFTDKDASGHKTACARMLSKLDYAYAARKAAEYSVESRNPGRLDAGRYDVIFDPMAFSVILDNIAGAASIFSVESGLSFFNTMLGEKVAASSVNITDDGSMPNGYASSSYDAEGTPTQKTKIIENGILKNYLHNYSTAKRYNAKNTANAGLVSPEPWNTVLENGKRKNELLLKSMDKGLYITNLWYTRYQNHATGDFSTIPRDGIFFVENGKIKRAVKDIRISDNMINIMKNIKEISSQPEQVIGWETEKPVVTPTVLIKDLNITKSI